MSDMQVIDSTGQHLFIFDPDPYMVATGNPVLARPKMYETRTETEYMTALHDVNASLGLGEFEKEITGYSSCRIYKLDTTGNYVLEQTVLPKMSAEEWLRTRYS